MLWLCVVVMVFVVVGSLLSDCVGGNKLQWLLTNSWKFEIFVRQVPVAQNFVWREPVAQKIRLHNLKVCTTDSRRTKFYATAFLSHKKSDYTIWNFVRQVPSHQILCDCLSVAQKIWLHNLKFYATGSRRTKFYATAFLSHNKIWLHYLKFCATGSRRTKILCKRCCRTKKSYYTKFRLFSGGHKKSNFLIINIKTLQSPLPGSCCGTPLHILTFQGSAFRKSCRTL